MHKTFRIIITLMLGTPSLQAIPFKGSEILISAPSPYAVEVGQQVARAGGNVVDVAVAVGLTLAVTSPYFASLGGGGFALIKFNKKVEALDFREMAPKATNKEFFVQRGKEASITGGAAVGVPGIPAGLWELHKKYGKLNWRALFPEPLKYSKEGFRVSGEWVEYTEETRDRFDVGGKKHFLKADKTVARPGDVLKQWYLSRALLAFRDKNVQGFYSGPVAKDIVDSVAKTGGVMTLEDLANYKVRWLDPMVTQFRDHKVYLMPPPSSGGVVIQTALELAKRVGVDKQAMFSVEEFHLLGEILSRAFKGRVQLGDPDFHKNPIERLLGAEQLDQLAKTISLSRSKQLEIDEGKTKERESTETTHFNVMDKNGNTVSLTITLNGTYGSGVVSNDYGIALNNEMDDFTTRPNEPNQFGLIQGQGNLVEAGKRPLSSMSPTIVEKDGHTVLALGAPGGPRIISGVFQALYRVLVSDLDMDEAIQAPRVHHQFRPHRLLLDRHRFTPETIKALKEKGHQVDFLRGIAKVYGIKRHTNGSLEAAFDSRGEGAVGGF